jgi:hypothetical protein
MPLDAPGFLHGPPQVAASPVNRERGLGSTTGWRLVRPCRPPRSFLCPEFTEHPEVADAASELLRDVCGDQTVSSRLVFGVASLPLGSPVELEVIFEVQP